MYTSNLEAYYGACYDNEGDVIVERIKKFAVTWRIHLCSYERISLKESLAPIGIRSKAA